MLVILFMPQFSVLAHPVDMYAQSQSLVLTQAGLQVDWQIIPGPLLADAVWGAADRNHDGAVSAQEAQAWCAPLLSQWSVTLDNRPASQLQVQEIHWPAGVDVLRTGEDGIHIKFMVPWAGITAGAHTLELHNSFLEANSVNWFSLLTRDGLSFDRPAQDNGRLVVHVSFPPPGAATPPATALTSWDSGKPSLPGFSAAVQGLGLPGAQASPAQDNGLTSTSATLVGLVKTQEASAWFLVGAFLLSLALGSLHALTPGHGKTLVAAYLVGSQGRVRDAIFLGSVVTLTHTGSVIALGLVTLLASHYILPSLIAPWLEVISGLLVVGFGINLFWQRKGDLTAWLAARRRNKSPQSNLQTAPGRHISLQNAHIVDPNREHPLAPLAPLVPLTPLTHSHGDHTHPHTHAVPQAGQVTMRSLLTLGISGGLVPCPDAIAILLVAVALNRIPLGMLLILAFSIGLAFVLIAIGIAMVQGARLVGHNDWFNRFSVYTPLISAIVVSGLGVGLTANALSSFSLAAAASQPNPAAVAQPAAFDLQQARLVYLAPDDRRQNQLTVLPLAGGTPATHTRESIGLASYALSPDRKTLIYTLIRIDGTSSLWGIDTDGAHRHLVLDCPQAQCGGPVWYPDGTRLVYERLNNPQASTLSVFSLWWLDLAGGKTSPVFQDQSFPAIAPGFSPDGQWLSYISPLNNTIQLYNLKGDRSTSISLARNYQPRIARPWDPVGGSLLFWDAPASAPGASLRLARYDPATAQRTDVGGPGTASAFEAAWSPDGLWIALTRDSSPPGQPNSRQQIWLEKADGSQGRALVDEKQVSYSSLSWSPDGRSLVYCRYSTAQIGVPEIWLAGLSGAAPRKLVTGGIMPALLP